ncbi:hypothetical protein EAH87_04820 [Sphingomonas koreensis]|nr:hypothetical protein EAH87_04820 [Sphingomonas koreensis]
MMNDIANRQNEPRMLDLMKARRATYDRATAVQVMQLIVVIALPLALAILGLFYDASRPWVAIGSFLAVIVDGLVLDRRQRVLIERAAKISEQFDCELLVMDWDAFTAGRHVDPETIASSARFWKGDIKSIMDWYPAVPPAAPLYLARLICQRANLWYDSSLRKRLGGWLSFAVVFVLALLIIAGLAAQLDLANFAIVLLAPATPFVAWAIRERYRQMDAAEAIELIKDDAEDMTALAIGGTATEANCTDWSRRFQSAIYARRVSNPLLLPLMYRFMRDEKELEMTAGATELLRQAGIPVERPGDHSGFSHHAASSERGA